MRVVTMVQRQLGEGISVVHAARRAALFAVVEALLRCGRIALTALGRSVATETSDKHGIKRVDRLLGNAALHGEREDIYGALARLLISWWQRPIILVDWTDSGTHLCVLSAALAFEGRGILLWSEAHPLAKLSNADVEREFLFRLHALLPAGCLPIIVTDGGFHVPWCREVERLGWDYVARVRGKVMVRPAGTLEWIYCKQLFALSRSRPRDLGEWDIVRCQDHRCRLVTADRRSRRAKLPPSPYRRRRHAQQKIAESAREPWLLATSLLDDTARRVVNIYWCRMQIEQSFRDLKSHRFGWGFEDVRTIRPERVDIILMLATLATFAAILVGLAAERDGRQYAFQANTIRTRRVLSLVWLGQRIIARGKEPESLLDTVELLRRRSLIQAFSTK